jgi:hypothetical protein
MPLVYIYAKILRRRENRRSILGLTQESQMHTLRSGRIRSLPSTIAIKHHRTLVARYEVEKAEAEGRVDLLGGRPSPAVTSVTPFTEIDAAPISGRIRAL